jgi:GNAT superfamily N-acetyltransferase
MSAQAKPQPLPDVHIRPAQPDDVGLILSFIRELAEYEKLAHEAVADEETLRQHLFGANPRAEVLIAEVAQEPAGFCLFFHNFSTFLGRPGLYIEDVFVREAFRAQGIGKQFFAELARIAKTRGCGRIEWWVLDWNQPAIDFYRRMGAVAMDEWTVYRLTEEKFASL